MEVLPIVSAEFNALYLVDSDLVEKLPLNRFREPRQFPLRPVPRRFGLRACEYDDGALSILMPCEAAGACPQLADKWRGQNESKNRSNDCFKIAKIGD